jgi:hypothetical protein
MHRTTSSSGSNYFHANLDRGGITIYYMCSFARSSALAARSLSEIWLSCVCHVARVTDGPSVSLIGAIPTYTGAPSTTGVSPCLFPGTTGAAYLLLHTRTVSLAPTITRSDISNTYDSTSCYTEQVDQNHEIQRTRSGSVFGYRSRPVQRLTVCCISSYHQIRQLNPQWVSPTEKVSIYAHMR